MSYKVMEHVLDGDSYRLVVGWAELVTVPQLDAQGQPMYGDPVPALDENGNQLYTDPVAELDETGEPIFDEGEIMLDADGEPVIDPDTEQPVRTPVQRMTEREPLFMPGPLLTVEVEQIVAVEDFLFAADDPRWERFKSDETIAAKQREIVKQALEEREQQAEAEAAAAAQVTHLSDPGSTL